jgi:hypothetical protein
MRLYHFTCLLWLPEILKDGITLGEVPTGPTRSKDRPNAANLTNDPDPRHQSVWTGRNAADKTKVRLTVEVPDNEVMSFRQLVDRFKIKSSWLKRIDPSYQRPHWFFAFDGVSPEKITTVEIREGDTYKAISGEELQQFVARITEERDARLEITIKTTGFLAGTPSVRFKEGFKKSWLLDNLDEEGREQPTS